MLFSHYQGFTKSSIDELEYGIELLRREAEELPAASNYEEWKKGIEVVPQGKSYILIHHRYPKMTGMFKKSDANPKNNDFLDFYDIEDAEIREMDRVKKKMNDIVKSLGIMKINKPDTSISYFQIYVDQFESVDPRLQAYIAYPI